MRRTMWPVVVVLLGSSACGLIPSGPDFPRDGFTVTARAGHLTLRNESPATIHYVAVEEETSALVDPYFDAQEWPGLAPGEERRIPYEHLTGYRPGARQARVYWWTTGEYRPHVLIDPR